MPDPGQGDEPLAHRRVVQAVEIEIRLGQRPDGADLRPRQTEALESGARNVLLAREAPHLHAVELVPHTQTAHHPAPHRAGGLEGHLLRRHRRREHLELVGDERRPEARGTGGDLGLRMRERGQVEPRAEDVQHLVPVARTRRAVGVHAVG